MELYGLREVILENPQIAQEEAEALAEDEAKNGEAYAELVQFLDNKGLSLIKRDARVRLRLAMKLSLTTLFEQMSILVLGFR